MLKETIASMLKSVTSKTAPITNEAIDDTMRRVRTLAITSHEPITAAALQAHEYDRRTAIGGITPDLVQRSYPVELTSCQQDPTV